VTKKKAKEILIDALSELQGVRGKPNYGTASVLIFSALTGYFGLPINWRPDKKTTPPKTDL